MKKAVLFLLHPKPFAGVRNLGCRVGAGGFNVVRPAHVMLVDNHGVAEGQSNAANVASWPQFPVGGLGELDVVVRHGRLPRLTQYASVFELEGGLPIGRFKFRTCDPCQEVERNDARLGDLGERVVAKSLQ